MATNADHLVGALRVSGVERIHGLSGDSLNGLTDAVRRADGMAWAQVRHEETAAFAAGAEAALTGGLAACAGSCGPGNLHLINGLFDAQRSRVPVLAIAAHIPHAEIGSSYFQETHPERLFTECSVYCELVSEPSQLPHVLRRAMRAAVEQRGVAVVVVPGEILLAEVDPDAPAPRPVVAARSHVVPHADDLAAAAAILDAGEKVTILAGAGCAGAHAELLSIAEKLRAPIVHALRGAEHIAYDNPYDVGLTGLLGISSAAEAMSDADVLLVLGSDLPYREFYPDDARVVQLDLRGEVLGRRVDVELGLVGSVADTVPALLPLLRERESGEHLASAQESYRSARASLDALADDDASPLRPERTTRALDRLAADDAVFTTDVGSPVVWAARYLTMNGRRRLLGSFWHGSMAGAVPQAIGAASADPTRQVVALAGDGGLTMLLGELFTLVQSRLPVTVVVYNNASYNFVELEMKAAGVVTFGTDLENTDLAAVATAMGLFARHVDDPADLDGALAEALAHDGPALVDVSTARQVLAVPPTITASQVKGFALYGIRSVLAGQASELVDVVRTNVVRRVVSHLPGHSKDREAGDG